VGVPGKQVRVVMGIGECMMVALCVKDFISNFSDKFQYRPNVCIVLVHVVVMRVMRGKYQQYQYHGFSC
jgi:hypothetical protein